MVDRREKASVKRMRFPAWALLVLAVLALPLGCLALGVLLPNPMFSGRFTVENRSTGTLYITPVGEAYGERYVLAKQFSRFPYLSLFQRSEFRLEAGASLHFACDVDEDTLFSEIVVRNPRGAYRQLAVGESTSTLVLYPSASGDTAGPTYALESFAALSSVEPAALAVAQRAGGAYWTAWGACLLGLTPVALFVTWIRLLLARRRAARSLE
jgi:hypothetical protein